MHWAYRKNFEQGIYHMGDHRILGYDMNEKYMGDLQLQKLPPKDYLTKKPMRNDVKNKMDEADADHANGIYRNGIETHCLYGIVFYAQCGSPMVRRTYLNRKKANYKGWNCRGRQHKNGCTNPLIRETDLIEELMEAMDMRGIPDEETAEDRITRNIRRVDIGPEEIEIAFSVSG